MPKEVVDRTYQIYREILDNLQNRDESEIAEALDIPASLVRHIINKVPDIEAEEIIEAVMEDLEITDEDDIIQ